MNERLPDAMFGKEYEREREKGSKVTRNESKRKSLVLHAACVM
jgi:hypothetical protein